MATRGVAAQNRRGQTESRGQLNRAEFFALPVCSFDQLVRPFAHSPPTFHACNVRARVMKTPIEDYGGADLNHELEKANFSMASGDGGNGSGGQCYRGI